MKLEQLIEEIGPFERREWAGKYANITGLFSQQEDKWISTKDLVDKQNFYVWGDDRGDKFVDSFNNEDELLKSVQKYYDGDTGADFETHIYLIVKNGNKQKKVIELEDF